VATGELQPPWRDTVRAEDSTVSSHDHDGHDHEGSHDHDHDGHDHDAGHDHPGGIRGVLEGLLRPHSHDAADSFDDALESSREGLRALKISLLGLGATALVEVVIVVVSGSVALLADAIHNLADALTAVPIGVAFVLGRRPANRSYTYGYGRAEDLAGIAVIGVMAASSVVAAAVAIDRLVHPDRVGDLWAVAAAGLVGFAGNELVARYRIRIGRRIGSAALEADGYHARTDGFTSLAVVAGAAGVALGWRDADPAFGLAITVGILSVIRRAALDIYRRLMDAVDPALVGRIEAVLGTTPGVEQVDAVRVRWIGHQLHAEAEIVSDATMSLAAAHDVAELARHRLLHDVRRLTDATIHSSPTVGAGPDPHGVTAHHRTVRQGPAG
jgi:cation diffusion facilitator family transporter